MATLAELRDQAFLDQQELADKAGVSVRTIQRAEAGEYRPRRKTIRKLAKILKIDPWEIEFPSRRRD